MPDAMPASSTECVSHLVGETLTASFAASGFGNRAPFNSSRPTCDLQQKLASASKRILMKKIEFASGSKQSSFQLDNLRAKLTPLNSPTADATNCYKNSNNASGAVATTKGECQVCVLTHHLFSRNNIHEAVGMRHIENEHRVCCMQ